jgi:dihydroneopterin aldolase
VIDVELTGLRVFGHHGVDEDERQRGQDFLYDIVLRVHDAASSDRLGDTVDYRDVAACVRELSASRRFSLLEALATAAADEILARFSVDAVRVRVRKPNVSPAGLDVDWAAATVERTR